MDLIPVPWFVCAGASLGAGVWLWFCFGYTHRLERIASIAALIGGAFPFLHLLPTGVWPLVGWLWFCAWLLSVTVLIVAALVSLGFWLTGRSSATTSVLIQIAALSQGLLAFEFWVAAGLGVV